ncbi:MAG: hypothetical protein ACTSU5_06485 [Promethearchaeota archaeon]
MDSSSKKCCTFCIGLIVLGVWWLVQFQSPYWENHQWEDNSDVNMSVESVHGSIVVWPNGVASVTQIMSFKMDPYRSYELHGIYWPTLEGSGAEGHLVKDASATVTVDGQTRNLSVYIDNGGTMLYINGIDISGSYASETEFNITTTYTTKNAICHVDPVDGLVKFAFIPPTFSHSSTYYADYFYDVVFTNITLSAGEYTVPDYGVTQAKADDLGFVWVAGTLGWGGWDVLGDGPRAINLTGAIDMDGNPIDPSTEMFGVSVYRKMGRSDDNKFISFKLGPKPFNIPKSLEDNTPADYWSLEEQGLLFWGVGIVTLVVLIALSGHIARGFSKLGFKLLLVKRKRAHKRKERAEIKKLSRELEEQGYIVPPESRKSYSFLRALSETIYTDEYKELLARGEIKKVDLLKDYDHDGDVDEDDLTFILSNKLREIYERDILEELEKAGMLE